MKLLLSNEISTAALAGRLALLCNKATVIYLIGELGVGKTSFCRGFLVALGYLGRVKSPSYSLVEVYRLAHNLVYHCDLYRLTTPEELEFIAVRDLQKSIAIWLIEWPQKGMGFLPTPDVTLHLSYYSHMNMRRVHIRANSDHGENLLRALG